MQPYTEFCEKIAAQLFNIIDSHDGLLKWKKEWNVIGSQKLPMSHNGYYRGSNLLYLWMLQNERGWLSNQWLTFLQVKQNGGHVLKGAKGVDVCFWKLQEIEDSSDDSDKKKMLPIFRTYTVFNFDQTSLTEHLGIEAQSPVLRDLLNLHNVQISEFGNQPCYKSREDVIVMPMRQYFNQPQDYDVTILHELVHWTGRADRLDRQCKKDYAISDAARAEEELVAEIGAVFLAGHFGLTGDVVNHASYISSWKKYLDSKAVTRAITQASQAFHWLISKVGEEGAV